MCRFPTLLFYKTAGHLYSKQNDNNLTTVVLYHFVYLNHTSDTDPIKVEIIPDILAHFHVAKEYVFHSFQ